MTEGIRPTGERVQEVTEACEPKRHRSEKCWLQRQIHTTVCNCVRTTKAIDQEEYPVQVQRRTETDVPGLSEDPMRWHLMWTCCSARQIGVDPNQTSLSKHFMAVDRENYHNYKIGEFLVTEGCKTLEISTLESGAD
ncbi:UPF0538 protein C2orf76 homolog isoform X4 [Mobula birostris]|uniref:UPF0538 protein C2orf76 homolog isoform X4 n=1 Tax=Mobula birostris TaxID=1983395 RepID=UPI003B282F93